MRLMTGETTISHPIKDTYPTYIDAMQGGVVYRIKLTKKTG